MGVYDRQVASAQKAINKKGVDGILWDGTTQYPLKGLVAIFNWSERQNSFVEPKDRKIFIAAADLGGIVPKETFKWSFVSDYEEIPAATKCRIVTSEPLNPGGQSILYTLQVRR